MFYQKVTYGKNTFKNYGTHICNLLPNEIKTCTNSDKFKSLLKSWEGPKCQCKVICICICICKHTPKTAKINSITYPDFDNIEQKIWSRMF